MKMRKILLTALIATAMASCAKKAATPAIDPANFDESVALNEDFYQHFTGGWQQKNPLKPEYSRYGAFDVLRENNEIRINELFTQMTKENYPEGSSDRKITDLYKLGLDSVRLNAEGAAPVKEMMARMAAADRKELMNIMSQMHVAVAGPFFGIGIESDLMNSNEYAVYAGQGGLGMGNRDYYLDEENAPKREAYVKYLTELFTLAGVENPSESAAGVMRIETALAEKMWSRVQMRDVLKQYNPMSRADFEKRYAGSVDWNSYFATIGLSSFDRIIVGQPDALDNAFKLMASVPVEDLRSYLAAQYLNSAASYLGDEF